MPKLKCKNTIEQFHLLKPSHPTNASSKYSNTAKAQENYLKNNFITIIEVLKEKMNKSPLSFKSRITNQNDWGKSVSL